MLRPELSSTHEPMWQHDQCWMKMRLTQVKATLSYGNSQLGEHGPDTLRYQTYDGGQSSETIEVNEPTFKFRILPMQLQEKYLLQNRRSGNASILGGGHHYLHKNHYEEVSIVTVIYQLPTNYLSKQNPRGIIHETR